MPVLRTGRAQADRAISDAPTILSPAGLWRGKRRRVSSHEVLGDPALVCRLCEESQLVLFRLHATVPAADGRRRKVQAGGLQASGNRPVAL